MQLGEPSLALWDRSDVMRAWLYAAEHETRLQLQHTEQGPTAAMSAESDRADVAVAGADKLSARVSIAENQARIKIVERGGKQVHELP